MKSKALSLLQIPLILLMFPLQCLRYRSRVAEIYGTAKWFCQLSMLLLYICLAVGFN